MIVEQVRTIYVSTITGKQYDTRKEGEEAEFAEALLAEVEKEVGQHAAPEDVIVYILEKYELKAKGV